jgi:MiaB-like tRNA modifying enzyme
LINTQKKKTNTQTTAPMSSEYDETNEDFVPLVYGEGDDEALPEDLYYRDITSKIKLTNGDDLDDIENLHENVPLAGPPRERPEIIPEPYYPPPNDPSSTDDTLYGANTNTYTTDDNTTYTNPALLATKKSNGGCGDDCGCDESKPQEKAPAKGGCDNNNDCGCATPNETTKKSDCTSGNCGCDDDGSQTTQTQSDVQTFGKYATTLAPGQNPQNSAAPIKASTVGTDYQFSGVSNIPGLGTVWIKTWGCSHNTSDGEYMAGLLSQAGYTITNNEHEAQIWICNSCSVKGPSEQSFFNELKRGRSLGKGVIVAGCVPQAHPNHPHLATFSGKAKAMSGMQIKKLKKNKTILEAERAKMLLEGKTSEEIDAWIDEQQDILKNQLISQHKDAIDAKINVGVELPTENDPNTQPYSGVVSVLGTDNIHRVVEVVEATLQGNSLSFLTNTQRHRPANDLALPKIRKNPFVEIISINTGCLNNCTYCKTKHARGNLRSYPIDEIVDRVKQSLDEGVIEIWLTSEDLGAYGIDIGVRVHHLVDEILKVMPEGTFLRMGMSNPPYFKDILEPMYDIFKHKNCYEFLHIPVQAGADAVLNDMKRDYTNFEFQTICDELIKHVPTLTLATDFICGFPTETEEDWRLSVQLVEKYKFPVVFINQFYPRPGTPAHSLPQLPPAVLKARSKELVTLFNSYNTRANREGEIWDVLVTDMSRDNDFMVGHTKRYDQVLIPAHPQIMGKCVKVKITKAEKHYLISELVPGTVEEANKKKTILPVGYKHWQFSQYLDSNLDSFIPPVTAQIAPVESAPTTTISTAKRNLGASVVLKGVDDEDEMNIVTKKRSPVQSAPATAVQPAQPENPVSTKIGSVLTQEPSHTAVSVVSAPKSGQQLNIVLAIIVAVLCILIARRL